MPDEPDTALSATSVDGLHFTLEVPVERLALRVGGYVVVDVGGRERLAYTTEVALDPSDRRLARVEGRMLDGRGEPFGDAAARMAAADDVRSWLDAARPARAALVAFRPRAAVGVVLLRAAVAPRARLGVPAGRSRRRGQARPEPGARPFAPRWTVEGGADVPADWAARRA